MGSHKRAHIINTEIQVFMHALAKGSRRDYFKVQRKPICAEINVTSALISKIIRSDKKQYSVTFYRFLPGNIQCILCNIFFIPGYYAEQCVNTMLNVWWNRSCIYNFFMFLFTDVLYADNREAAIEYSEFW